MFDDAGFGSVERFHAAWNSVRIEREVHYGLFTFGESDAPYFLVLSREPGETVLVTQGVIRITRPLIVTPDNLRPEFENFFQSDDEHAVLPDFLMARTAMFSNLKLFNQQGSDLAMASSANQAIDRLQRQLDDEDEDRVAIISAPVKYRGVALMKYAAERISQSAASNIQELREKGLLP